MEDPKSCTVAFLAGAVVLSYAISWYALPLLAVAALIVSRRLPSWRRKRSARRLRDSCNFEMDACADVIAMGVSAGLSFDAALELYCSKFSGPLQRELQGALMQWRNGLCSRKEALKRLGDRLGSDQIRRFGQLVVQAQAQGASLGKSLSQFACDVRKEKRAQVLRQVEKAPLKLLIPTATCILPAMLVFVMGPVVLQMTTTM